jgi:hypothetical protein
METKSSFAQFVNITLLHTGKTKSKFAQRNDEQAFLYNPEQFTFMLPAFVR